MQSPTKIESNLFYIAHMFTKAMEHGKINEPIAIAQLEKQLSIKVLKCWIFIDAIHLFWAASPDGLIENRNEIIEIKCPSSAFNMDPDNAIKSKKIKCWKIINDVIEFNKKHQYYYQVQGQLHITGRDACIFGVWTGSGHNMKYERIVSDDVFFNTKMLPKLLSFYI